MNLIAAWQFILKGGPVMVVIVGVSVLCLAMIVERFLALRRSLILPQAMRDAILTSQPDNAGQTLKALARVQASPLANLVLTAIDSQHLGERPYQEELERVGRREAMGLEKNLVFLGILAGLGPLLGLFGTVTGMISIFHAVQLTGVGSPQELSGGISESLLCTAGGMVIGIPALIFHRYFHHRVEHYVMDLEAYVAKVVALLRPKA